MLLLTELNIFLGLLFAQKISYSLNFFRTVIEKMHREFV